MKKLRALKNRKGFTLVEIIVVLVILAVLAAAAIPTMLGFVEDSKGKALVAEARVGYVAAQALFTEYTATNSDVKPWKIQDGEFYKTKISSSKTLTETETVTGEKDTIFTSRFEILLGEDVKPSDFSVTFDDDGVTQVIYKKTGSKYTITLNKDGVTLVNKDRS